MRRLAMLVTLVAIATVLGLGPASATTGIHPPPRHHLVMVADDGSGNCVVYLLMPPALRVGESGYWSDFYADDVTVNEVHGFWSFAMQMVPHDGVTLEMRNAGTFYQECGGAAEPFAVRLKVVKETADPTFRVRWATLSSGGYIHTVQVKRGQNGKVHVWRSRTTDTSDLYTGEHGQVYYFRARTYTQHHHTDWSPWARVIVD
jgi:hypothetical protein